MGLHLVRGKPGSKALPGHCPYTGCQAGSGEVQQQEATANPPSSGSQPRDINPAAAVSHKLHAAQITREELPRHPAREHPAGGVLWARVAGIPVPSADTNRLQRLISCSASHQLSHLRAVGGPQRHPPSALRHQG